MNIIFKLSNKLVSVKFIKLIKMLKKKSRKRKKEPKNPSQRRFSKFQNLCCFMVFDEYVDFTLL